jgi:hypothetical protein
MRRHATLPIASALLLLAAAVPGLCVQPVVARVVPERPVAGEEFVLELSGDAPRYLDYMLQRSTVSLVGGELTIKLDFADAPLGNPRITVGTPPSGPRSDFIARQTTRIDVPGTYPLVYAYSNPVLNPYPDPGPVVRRETLGSVTVDAPRAAAAPHWTDLSGNFFSPDENGSGVNVIQSGTTGQVFAAWFTYTSIPRWYVASGGKWISPTAFRGLLYETMGRPLDRPFDRTYFTVLPVGVLTLDFASRDAVEMDAQLITFGGVRSRKRLQRQQF